MACWHDGCALCSLTSSFFSPSAMTMRIGGMQSVPCFSTVARMLFFNSSRSM